MAWSWPPARTAASRPWSASIRTSRQARACDESESPARRPGSMIDSHCHLAGEEFAGDLGQVVARARAAGVSSVLCILAATDAAEYARADIVRAAWPAVRFATGVHPHQAGQCPSPES